MINKDTDRDIGNYILSRRKLLQPWKKEYVKFEHVDYDTVSILKTDDIDEAKVFHGISSHEYMRIEDDYFYSRWGLEPYNKRKKENNYD